MSAFQIIKDYWQVGVTLVGLVAWATSAALSGPTAAAAVDGKVTAIEQRVQRVETAVGKINDIATSVVGISSKVTAIDERSLQTWNAVTGLVEANSDLKADIAGLKASNEVRDRLLTPKR